MGSGMYGTSISPHLAVTLSTLDPTDGPLAQIAHSTKDTTKFTAVTNTETETEIPHTIQPEFLNVESERMHCPQAEHQRVARVTEVNLVPCLKGESLWRNGLAINP